MQLNNLNSNQTNSSWACPCNGCKKAQKVIIDQIIDEYKSCPNIVDEKDRVYCYTWWRHDDCVRIMNLLNTITKSDKYSLPPKEQQDDIINQKG